MYRDWLEDLLTDRQIKTLTKGNRAMADGILDLIIRGKEKFVSGMQRLGNFGKPQGAAGVVEAETTRKKRLDQANISFGTKDATPPPAPEGYERTPSGAYRRIKKY
jgi:hypothetical protein